MQENEDVSMENRSGILMMPKKGLPSTGKLKVLVVPVYPTNKDQGIKDGTGKLANTWKMVRKYYDQASYGKLDVSVKCIGWSRLSGDSGTYVTNDKDKNGNWLGVAPNVKCESDYGTMNRLWSEAAQAAKASKVSIDNYDILVCVINLDGNIVKNKKSGNRRTPIRGYGDYATRRFIYKASGLDIDIPLKKDIRLIVVDEQASWGRCAHEVGHCLITDSFPPGSSLSEDLYPEDGVDSTAAGFDLMGHHEEAPLLSGCAMEALKFYEGDRQVKEIDWRSSDVFGDVFEVAAHGLEPNKVKGRYNLLKIAIADGLYYYVEVRQRSRGKVATDQVFDKNINLGTMQYKLSDEANVGGVVVTQVVTEPSMRTNQEMRSITLLHNQQRLTTEEFADIKAQDMVDPRLPHVLKAGEGEEGVASDPLRGITITALEPIRDRPLTYKVKVEWDKTLLGLLTLATGNGEIRNPEGSLDLWIKRDDGAPETEDIWVERPPFGDGKWDYGYDHGEKRPKFGGDRPLVGAENRVWVRVRCKGDKNADDVGVHLYSISPPGFGGNGNWSPINFIAAPVKKGKYKDFGPISWTPSGDNATSLTACIDPRSYERIYSDNWAQQVVFDVDSEYFDESDTPSAVLITLALHNPIGERATVQVRSESIPGFDVKLPGAVELEPWGSKNVNVTIKPTKQYKTYVKKHKTNAFKVRLSGYVTDRKNKEYCVGSASAWVSFKPKVDIHIRKNEDRSVARDLFIDGFVKPIATGKVHVVLSGSAFTPIHIPQESVAIRKDGTFRARFKGLAPGEYKVTAHLVNSTDAARTKSNEIKVALK